MGRTTRAIDIVDAALREAEALDLVHLSAEDERLDGRHVRLGGHGRLHFGSCSYLGLELDPRLRAGACDAIERFGVQFSSSRSYLATPLYQELESLLEQIFDASVLVLPSTTLAHLAALPILVEEDDAVVLDHQVHQSVRLAIAQVQVQGSPIEIVRHGRIEELDERVRELAARHRRVWYLADGVYSAYGDFAPAEPLRWLLERHERLHLYLDDAHGMSWTGRHGRGFAAEVLGHHPRVVIAVSLNKAFAAAGGALVLPDARLRERVRNCGGPVIFGGPIQPPLLGAAVASARIHLSPEIDRLQAELRERVVLANRLAQTLDLPLASRSEVPIRFVGLGKKRAAFDMTAHLFERGFYVNVSAFPVVAPRNAGIRLTLTRHHRPEDITRLLEEVAARLPASLAAAGTTRAQVDRAFGLRPRSPAGCGAPTGSLSCRHETTIHALDRDAWDGTLRAHGGFPAATLATFEEAFGPQQPPENRWQFHYYSVCDAAGRPLLRTYFTQALWKDDLLAAAKVSKVVEQRRATDPYFLTSQVLAMGCLLSEGDHLHLDRSGDWRGALSLLLAALEREREESGTTSVVLRDLDPSDEELRSLLEAEGFVQVALPESMLLTIDWRTPEEFLARRTRHERKFHEKHVAPWSDAWEVRVLPAGARVAPDDWAHLYELYLAVQRRQLGLNTFPLPTDLLPRLHACPGWEILLFHLRPAYGGDPAAPPLGFVAAHASGDLYSPVLGGMDYRYAQSHGLYRQLLARSLARAQARGARRVAFGMGSELEKARFGARPVARALYVQTHDRYHHDLLALIAADAALGSE